VSSATSVQGADRQHEPERPAKPVASAATEAPRVLRRRLAAFPCVTPSLSLKARAVLTAPVKLEPMCKDVRSKVLVATAAAEVARRKLAPCERGQNSVARLTYDRGEEFSIATYTPLYIVALMDVKAVGSERLPPAALFESLADPTRRVIIEALLKGEQPVGELVERVAISQSGVSRHLRILTEAGFVQARAQGTLRLYSLQPGPFRQLSTWLDRYRMLWEKRLGRFERALEAKQQSDAIKKGNKS
jgi:DNA-binding transcriptional ArsR family regulator